jgi:hypothetical protein
MKSPVLQLTAIILVSVPTLLQSTYNQTGLILFSRYKEAIKSLLLHTIGGQLKRDGSMTSANDVRVGLYITSARVMPFQHTSLHSTPKYLDERLGTVSFRGAVHILYYLFLRETNLGYACLWGHAVEALCYKPKGRRFDSQVR